MIYPVDSVIHLLNNWCLEYRLFVCSELENRPLSSRKGGAGGLVRGILPHPRWVLSLVVVVVVVN